MQLKSIKTEVNGHPIVVNFPDKKSIILRGQNNLHLLYVIEMLLSSDYTEYYKDLDKNYGFYYKNVSGLSQLMFTNGSIVGKDKKIYINGQVPKLHCIRYLKDGEFRSFLFSDEIGYSEIYNDMTEYSTIIPDTAWIRLCTLVNNLIGSEVVVLNNRHLEFNWDNNSEFSIQAQKFIYMIFSECFLTPKGYLRILLFPDIDILSPKQQVNLIESLDNIIGHEMCISTGDIAFSDVAENSVVTFVNV